MVPVSHRQLNWMLNLSWSTNFFFPPLSNLICIVYVTVADYCGLNFVVCFLCYFKKGMLGQVSVICHCVTFFVPHFSVSAWRLKCTKHMCPNSDVVQ